MGLTVLLLAGGCAVGPGYQKPKPKLAAAYADTAGSGDQAVSRVEPGTEALRQWWLVFNDPELNSLIDRAARGNRDVQRAVSRIREARARREMVGAGLGPEVDLSAGYNRGRGSENVQLPFGGGGGGASGGGGPPAGAKAEHAAGGNGAADPPADGGGSSRGGAAAVSPFGLGGLPGVTTNLYQVGFDASWEIDVFGGTRRAIEAAEAGVEAAEEGRRSVLVSLLAEVAGAYLELRTIQERLHIAQENLAAQRKALGVVEAKAKAGFATDLAVAQEQAQVATTEAAIPALESAEQGSRHALAFLLGDAPNALDAELAARADLPDLPPTVPIGVPSDLLRRRPDIRRAERELAQATAGVGVATADLFPSFSLTGMFGFDSSDVKHLAEWSSRYYSIAPGIHWPILDWGRIRANVRVRTEQQQQAFLVYQQAVSQALKDVAD
ncbi:MAG TPA: efflux transporter outer membrane subunit, partial [Opitutus sp.]|nr:efflux transporter outer membrane subunit [Opitutus sp.]